LFGFYVGIGNVGGIDISPLLFANDILIFCGVDLDNLCHLRCLFICLETDSGLKINLAKLELVLVSNVDNVDVLGGILCCRVSCLPSQYLGLPLGASSKAKSIWDGYIEKIERQLVS